jgi:tetratricopeptide (TPR) repeat protein
MNFPIHTHIMKMPAVIGPIRYGRAGASSEDSCSTNAARSLAIAREIGDKRNEESALIGLGNVYQLIGESSKAVQFYEKSLAISREIGDKNVEGSALSNLGNFYRINGHSPKLFLSHFEQAITIFQEIGGNLGGNCSC